ncbi:hypothetical protein [Thermoanaerobacter sp. RKWS2]|uniref:hypothetical protein n=1 Tax=Thermoanaerobacter sp. RKWS2 TaxID=2983842 RepID=UPI00224B6192|nr:hypothetical protein [Thermoanaerobacter sp. RKWS2]UZQ83939.1 hypothetical protein OEI98_001092 [Thermoanaerobacter sp. RKWS2]
MILEGKTEDLKNLSKEEEYILYLRNSAKSREKLRKYELQFEILSDVTLKTTLRLGQKELFYSVFSDPDFEVLNLEKKARILRRFLGGYMVSVWKAIKAEFFKFYFDLKRYLFNYIVGLISTAIFLSGLYWAVNSLFTQSG